MDTTHALKDMRSTILRRKYFNSTIRKQILSTITMECVWPTKKVEDIFQCSRRIRSHIIPCRIFKENQRIQKNIMQHSVCWHPWHILFEPKIYISSYQDACNVFPHIRSKSSISYIRRLIHSDILPKAFAEADIASLEKNFDHLRRCHPQRQIHSQRFGEVTTCNIMQIVEELVHAYIYAAQQMQPA